MEEEEEVRVGLAEVDALVEEVEEEALVEEEVAEVVAEEEVEECSSCASARVARKATSVNDCIFK